MQVSRPNYEPGVRYFRAPPPALTADILNVCAKLSSGKLPVRVPRVQMAGMRPHMCFENVRDVCAGAGGSALNGWLIWEWRHNFIEAEHHAVWHKDGRLLDVTPHACAGDSVLFVAEPERHYDFAGQRRVDNVRVALRSDASVREYLDLSARLIEIEETHTTGNEVALPPAAHREFELTRHRLRELERELVAWSLKHMGRNEPCWCGSGRKYKACCLGAAATRQRSPEKLIV